MSRKLLNTMACRKIEAGFREIKQDIDSAETQSRCRDQSQSSEFMHGGDRKHLDRRRAFRAAAAPLSDHQTHQIRLRQPPAQTRLRPRRRGFRLRLRRGKQTDAKSADRRGYGARGLIINSILQLLIDYDAIIQFNRFRIKKLTIIFYVFLR